VSSRPGEGWGNGQGWGEGLWAMGKAGAAKGANLIKAFIQKFETMAVASFRRLTVYQKAFALAMEIFKATKSFPVEEKYSLTDQLRRSSRSVCSNIAEGFRKRQYPAHFSAKASDADSENAETQVWLDFALHCQYLYAEMWEDFNDKSEEIGKLLNHMIINPDKY
jgi:four helix bundle protein